MPAAANSFCRCGGSSSGLALTLVIVFGLVSEFGSLATYAGLITAGLAVALQNVILAIVAYFFLIGRYGVRVGDRITLAGVTGRVVEIGLVRIYLMELAGPQMRSTGRMVVLSNAVLFQPTAMFKQMPGGDFYWHTITMVFAVDDRCRRRGETSRPRPRTRCIRSTARRLSSNTPPAALH